MNAVNEASGAWIAGSRYSILGQFRMPNDKGERSTCAPRDNRSSGSAPERPDREYLAARRAVREGLTRQHQMLTDSRLLLKNVERLNASFAQVAVEPLVREAVSSPNAMTRALLLAAAEVVQGLHESSSLVMEGKRIVLRRGISRDGTMSAELVHDRLALVDRLIAIKRALTRRKR